MILYAEVGKFRHRDRMLAMIPWTGAENVLDVGTGRGLLAIGAAKRLTTGRVVGIDIWNAADLTGNTADAFLANAEAEGVAERVEVRSADARRMPFPDASFDVVLSNVCLHNIPDAKGRAEACREIGRVLRPGGVALVSDFRETALYATAFREADFSVERSRSRPLRHLSADAHRHGPQTEGLSSVLEDRARRREPARASSRRNEADLKITANAVLPRRRRAAGRTRTPRIDGASFLAADLAEPQDLLDRETTRGGEEKKVRGLRDEQKSEESAHRETDPTAIEQEDGRDPAPLEAVETESLRERGLLAGFQEGKSRLEKMKAVELPLPGVRGLHLEEGLLRRDLAPPGAVEAPAREAPDLVEHRSGDGADTPALHEGDRDDARRTRRRGTAQRREPGPAGAAALPRAAARAAMKQNAPNRKSGSAEASDIHERLDVVFVLEPLLHVRREGIRASGARRRTTVWPSTLRRASRAFRRPRGLRLGTVRLDDADRVALVPWTERVRHAPVGAGLEVLHLEELVLPAHAGARVLGGRRRGVRSRAPSLRFLAEEKQLPVPDAGEAIATEGPGHDPASLRRPQARRR